MFAELDWSTFPDGLEKHPYGSSALGTAFRSRAAMHRFTNDLPAHSRDVAALLNIGRVSESISPIILQRVIQAGAISTAIDEMKQLPGGVAGYTDAELSRIARALAALKPMPAQLLDSLRFERALMLHLMDRMEADPSLLGNGTPTGILSGVLARWLMDGNRLASCVDHQEAVFAPHGVPVTEPEWKSFQELDRRLDVRWHGPLASRLLPVAAVATTTMSGIADAVYDVEAERNLAQVAVALARYRSAHGEFPEILNALVPDFLASIPSSPLDGKAVTYGPMLGRQGVQLSIAHPEGPGLDYSWLIENPHGSSADDRPPSAAPRE